MTHFMITYTQTGFNEGNGSPRQKMVCLEEKTEHRALVAFFGRFNRAHTQIVKVEKVTREVAEDFNRRQLAKRPR